MGRFVQMWASVTVPKAPACTIAAPFRSPPDYFDHNATAPVMREAREAWLEATEHNPGNASSPHQIGRRADAALKKAREKLAHFLGCHPADIVWTSGATEANNMVMHHFAQTLDAKSEVWISAIEHPCVHESSKHYFGKRARLIPVTHDGVIDLDWLTAELADTRPGLVGVMAANNETGVIQPWREALAICRQYQVPFFSDAVQWLGKMPAKGLGECDYLSGAAHKFGGPRGVGFLKVPHQSHVTPLLLGGKQEQGRRAGTENVPIIVSMLAALEAREKQMARSEHILRGVWRENFERQLLHKLPGTVIVGANSPRLWNTVSALMPEGVAIALADETRQGRICGFHRLRLHHRQGGAVARAGGDEFQTRGSASRAAFQQRLGNDRSRLGRPGRRPGQSPRRSASRQGVTMFNSLATNGHDFDNRRYTIVLRIITS